AVTRPLLDLVHGAVVSPSDGEQSKPGLEVLTEREQAVARAVADGATNAEIARQLYVSAATVKATVSRILTKLELDNQVQIAVVVRGSRQSWRYCADDLAQECRQPGLDSARVGVSYAEVECGWADPRRGHCGGSRAVS